MNILVIDVGGTHVKLAGTNHTEVIKIDSGPKMTPAKMVKDVLASTAEWKYDRISIGYPGPVVHDKPVSEPHNLGKGWVGFRYETALKKPVRMINDAAMQALGSYQGGRMLFLGLGTGLGSALIVEGVLQPLELAHLPYKKGKTFEEYVGHAGLADAGKKKWRIDVLDVIERLSIAMNAEYVMLGGGNAEMVDHLPKTVKMGDNANAVKGGILLWEKAKKIAEKTRVGR